MRLHEICHMIDGFLTRLVREEDRTAVLEFVRSGYDSDGRFIGRTLEQDMAMRCSDCPNNQCDNCPERAVPHVGATQR